DSRIDVAVAHAAVVGDVRAPFARVGIEKIVGVTGELFFRLGGRTASGADQTHPARSDGGSGGRERHTQTSGVSEESGISEVRLETQRHVAPSGSATEDGNGQKHSE